MYEFVDDLAIFSGLFVILGILLHMWHAASKSPDRRTMAPLDDTDDVDAHHAESDPERTTSNDDAKTNEAHVDAWREPTMPGGSQKSFEAFIEEHKQLKEQVERLIAREGRDQGLLADTNNKGRHRKKKKHKVSPEEPESPGAPAERPLGGYETQP